MTTGLLQCFSFKSGRESETTKTFLTQKVIVRVASINHAIILFENNSHVFVTLKRRRLHKDVNAGSGTTRISVMLKYQLEQRDQCLIFSNIWQSYIRLKISVQNSSSFRRDDSMVKRDECSYRLPSFSSHYAHVGNSHL